MKLNDIMEAVVKKKPPKPPAPRPKKTLWHDTYENWVRDVMFSYPEAEAHKTDDDQIVALSPEEDKCYGRWDPIDQKGVTFNKPRSVDSVVAHRSKTSKINTTNDTLRNYAHQ